MKKRTINSGHYSLQAILLACLAILSTLTTGCSDLLNDEPGGAQSDAMTETTISLGTDVPFGDYRTRADDAMGNTEVVNLWVGVYDISTGNRVGAKHFENPSSRVTLPVIYYDAHPYVAIVGVANYKGVTDWDGVPLNERLDAAETWNDFVDMNVRVPQVGGLPVVDPDEPQLMMGLLGTNNSRVFYQKSTTGEVSIESAGNTYPVNLSPSSLYGSMIRDIDGRIYLKRLHTQVNVTIKAGNNAEVTNVSFRRGNMPLGIYLAERPTYTGGTPNWGPWVGNTPNFADTRMTPSDGSIDSQDSYMTEEEWIPAGRDNTFSFTHYENKHWGYISGDDAANGGIFNREKLDNGVVRNLGHPYNNYASYFVIRMAVLDRLNRRSALVDYVIHEGNCNNSDGSYAGTNWRDYCSFRDMVYNYKITVNGNDNIYTNVTATSGHNDGISGEIWQAEAITVTSDRTAQFTIDGPALEQNSNKPNKPNLVMRFYVGRGPNQAPLDYISAPDNNLPEGIDGIYWPRIDENTTFDAPDPAFRNMFRYQKGSWWGYGDYTNDISEIGADARNWGGNYDFTFYPPVTAAQWNPEAYKMGIYYYDPDEVNDSYPAGREDNDHCSSYSGKVIHVAEWKPAQRQPQQLAAIRGSNYSISNYITPSATIDLRTAHNGSGNNGLTYGVDFVYYVTVNNEDYAVGSNLICEIPMSKLTTSPTSYTVKAVSLNPDYYTSSGNGVSSTITLTSVEWDFSSTTFENWFRSTFGISSGRYKASENIERLWNNGLYVCVGGDKEIGRPGESPAYLY